MLRRLSIFAISCFLLLSTVAYAQRDLGTITGTVTDPQGAAVANAKIVITEDATGLTYNVQSDESGIYARPLLKPGTYTVTVESAGFRKEEQKGIVVNPGERIAANISLQLGSASEAIEVSANAPLLQTESTTQGANLNQSEVSDLPLGGQRTFSFLARLSPGVLPAENGARDALGGGFSANGVRSTGENNFLLNGVDNNVNVIDFINQTSFVISPSVEAIGEMTILTNGYNAEYGRAAGGVVDVNLKSGTNAVHGVLFEILQNTDLDANRWENNLAGEPRDPFKQNQFGAAIGGPILKNKLFIFGDYQGTRISTSGGTIQNLGYGGFYTIPTPAMIAGNFSGLLGAAIGNGVLQNEIFDPNTTSCSGSNCTRTPYNNNTIPLSQMDPAALKIAALWPATNQAIKTGNVPQNDFFTETPGTLVTDQGDGRVDYRLSDKDSIFGSISWTNTSKTSIPPFTGALDGGNFNGSSEQDLGRNAQLGYTRVWSPTLISETRIAFSRLVTARTQANSETDEFSAVGIGGYDPTTTLNGGLPQFDLGPYSQVGANDWLPTKEYNNVWDFIQNVAITHGNHSLKFGFEFKPIQFPFFQVPEPHGELGFSRTETAYPSTLADSGGLSGFYNTDTGDPIASFLLGAIDTGQISTTNFISSTRQAWAGYAQDDWKLTPKLTLNIGVRYDLWSPIGEQHGRQSNFDFDTLTLQIPTGPNQNAALPPNFNAPYTQTVNGTSVTFPALFPNVSVCRGCVSQYLIPWDKADVGPRIGIAYNIRPKTVIRAAYGIFYGGEENQGGNPNRGESAPFNESPQLDRPSGVGEFAPDPFFANGGATGGLTIGFPTTVFTTTGVSSLQFREVSADFLNPMVQKWNFAIQEQLKGDMALEVGYQGNHSSHQLLQPDFNACPEVYTTNSTINCNALRPVPYIGGISGTASFGVGNYDALTAKLEKRMSRGLQFISSYTYGHALSDTGTTLSGSPGFNNKDTLITASNYSSAAWDIRHNFTTGFNYDVPFGKGKQWGGNLNRFTDTFLGNWHGNGILTLHTGQPYTLDANGCQQVGENGCFPDVVAGMNPNAAPAGGRTPSEYFNTAAVTAPGPLSGGNLGLQSNIGPPTRTLDFSLFKDFPLTERLKFQFRAESFNLLNTPQYTIPDNTLGDTNFGKITSTTAGSERHIQFSLRAQF